MLRLRRNCSRYKGIGNTNVQLRGLFRSGLIDSWRVTRFDIERGTKWKVQMD